MDLRPTCAQGNDFNLKKQGELVHQSSNRDAALALVKDGLRIFPCNPDKTPRVAEWQRPAGMAEWVVGASWKAADLPAIPLGIHGLLVIDCDRKPQQADGVVAFTALAATHQIDLSKTLVIETPSGGLHFYWRTSTPFGNSPGCLPNGIDVRGVGGYVIAPGAVLADGRSYRIMRGDWSTIAELPEALAALLRKKQAQRSGEPSLSVDDLPVTKRERVYADAAFAEDCPKVRTALEGSRNNTVNEVTFSHATMDGWHSVDPRPAILEAAIESGLTEAEARRTINSAWEDGKAKPRERLMDQGVTQDEVTAMIQSSLSQKRKQSSSNEPKAKTKRTIVLRSLEDISAKSVDWLWNGYLPKGMLTLLAGAGGTGKSTIAFSLAATVTNGGLWPDDSRCNVAGNVLIWSSEDSAEYTIKPRLMAAGVDASRCRLVESTKDENGNSCPFDPANDMDELHQVAESMGGVSLLIVDPIVQAVAGDMHKANDVRRGLDPVVRFAEMTGCAVLGITHFAKNTAGKNSADRVLGSQAFAALARMVLAAAKEEESDRRVFTRAKSNISLDTGGFSYSIEDGTLNGTIKTTRVVWGEALEGSARSILAEVEGEPSAGGPKSSLVKKYLLEQLRNGPTPQREIEDYALKTLGVSKGTLKNAKSELGIESEKDKAVFHGGWMWSLPSHPPSP